ncbi:MAG: hypothetical protein GY793_06985 [Proteobacteria bacterium]|nr:hypothetical protein [Pseudomonadota bacterium]
MQHLTRHSTKVNVIRAIVIISFAIWGISSYMNKSEKQEVAGYNWQLNTVIKTTKETPAFSQANISKTLGVIPKGENLLITSTADNGRWVEVKHGINRLWVQTTNLR